MNIEMLFDIDRLDQYVDEGFVSQRRHSRLPLWLYNYTAKTQYDNKWDAVTRHCRGLIVDAYGTIVGNCLPKFFNYGQEELDTSGPVQVTDKLDGSYLSVCLYDDQLITATRGSFDSAQAIMADKIIHDHPEYTTALKILCKDATAIFEVIYPQNRIVLDYGTLRDIVLIGTIANSEPLGKQIWIPASLIDWPGRTVQQFSMNSFAEAIALPPRENAEGIVIYFENTGHRLKIKQQDYLSMHRIMTNCTARRIWEYMAVHATKHLVSKPQQWPSYLRMDPKEAQLILEAGDDWKDKFLINVPDEFYNWITSKINEIESALAQLEETVRSDFARIWKEHGHSRKEFALAIVDHPHRDLLFCLANGAEIRYELWKRVRPEHEKAFINTLDA